jgi:hypothetical protein
MLWRFGISFFFDSEGYVGLASNLFDRAKPFALFRQAPYLLMNWLTASSANPLVLIVVQIVTAASAAAFLVWVIAKESRPLAGLIGVILLFDHTWMASNLSILLEGPIATLSVFALALAGDHYQRCFRIGLRPLFLTGLVFGWMAMFRPNYVLLVPLAIVFYLWGTRSWLRTATLTGGMVTVLVLTFCLNYWRTGHAALFRAPGFYAQFYLWNYGMMSPENGPASAELETKLRSCFGDKMWEAVTAYDNLHVVSVCLAGLPTGPDYRAAALPYRTYTKEYPGGGHVPFEAWDIVGQAFREAIQKHPLDYATHVGEATLELLSIPVYRLPRDAWLIDSPRGYAHYPPGVWNRICYWSWCNSTLLFPKRDVEHERWIMAAMQISRTTSAAHQLLTRHIPALDKMRPGEPERPTQQYLRAFRVYLHSMLGLWVNAACLGFFLLAAMVFGQGLTRFLALASGAFTIHAAVTTATANSVDMRFVSQLSPMYCLTTAIVIYYLFNFHAWKRALVRGRAE